MIIVNVKHQHFFFQQLIMASVSSQLESWLKCAVCQEILKNPKTLQCFHSFCEECIGRLAKTTHGERDGVNCPLCRAFTEKTLVKTNFLMYQFLETYKGNKFFKSE